MFPNSILRPGLGVPIQANQPQNAQIHGHLPEWQAIHLEPAPPALYERYERFYTRESIDASGNRILIEGKDPTIRLLSGEVVRSSADVRLVATAVSNQIALIVRERTSSQGFIATPVLPFALHPSLCQGGAFLQACIDMFSDTNNPELDVHIIGGYSLLSELLIGSVSLFLQELNQSVPVRTISTELKQHWLSTVICDFDSGRVYQHEEASDRSRFHPNYVRNEESEIAYYAKSIGTLGTLSEFKPEPKPSENQPNVYFW